MPTLTKYTYSIASDFPGGAVNTTNLQTEIQASSIVTALDRIDIAGDVLDIWFKDALSTEDRTTLDNDTSGPAGGLIAAHDNSATIQPADFVTLSHKLTTDGRIRVAAEKSDADSLDVFSHNWCDKTTWYSNAVRVVDEEATDSGDHITYDLANNYIIDIYHGKITQEDDLLDSSGNTYRVTVKVNSVVQIEVDPHTTQHPPEIGDYKIDYVAGQIIFQSALVGTETVEVTYHYATNSVLTLAPDPGNKLIIEVAEVQFTDDIDVTDSIYFQTWGYVDVFAPQLVDNPYPSGTQIPIKTFKYKTMKDYQNAAFKSYPTVPASGGLHWRGLTSPVLVFDWDYQRGLVLYSSYGMETRVFLAHDEPFGGTWATSTFYCGIDTETES